MAWVAPFLFFMVYPGGKNQTGVYHTIINQITPHHTFYDCFLGSGAITRHKKPSHVTFGVESNLQVLAKFDLSLVPGFIPVHSDAMKFLRGVKWYGDEFVYLDPPYLKETRRDQKRAIYKHEFWTPELHAELLDLILTIPCNVMISGYYSKLYASKLRRWRALSFRVVSRGRETTECLWMNYPEPVRLHDYTYFGDDYRQRQDFRRLVRRWRKKLDEMAVAKRNALLHEIDDSDVITGEAAGACERCLALGRLSLSKN